jgi:translation elongation factor aEF-1 beta
VEFLANAIITVKIMPESPAANLDTIQNEANRIIDSMAGPGDRKVEIEPIAFGLNALKITFVVNEKKGSADPIAEKMATIKDVMSAEVVDVRRAIG